MHAENDSDTPEECPALQSVEAINRETSKEETKDDLAITKQPSTGSVNKKLDRMSLTNKPKQTKLDDYIKRQDS